MTTSNTSEKKKGLDFDKIPLSLRVVTSSVIFVFLAGHLIDPDWNFDWIAVTLLAMLFLPWYIDSITSVTLPGGGKVDFGRDSSYTDNPVPPETETIPDATTPIDSTDAMKVLKTLWRYQKASFGADRTKRWTFAISPITPEYLQYSNGLNTLIQLGLASVNPENSQCMLTYNGILYAQENETRLEEFPHAYAF